MAAWIKMPLGMEVGLGPGNFVLDGNTASPPQKGSGAPKFSAHVYFGQTAGWIKMVLGMEVGLSPGDFLLHGDPAPSAKRGQSPSPVFGPFLLWPNGWMHQDATWYVGKPQPRFSAHVYYSYCYFVRTLHSRYWFVQVLVLVLYAFSF